jgi:urate oxidase
MMDGGRNYMPRIQSGSYGISRVRLLRIFRRGDRDDPQELTIALRFEGDFTPAFRDGETGGVLPSEAVHNFVRRAACEVEGPNLEDLALLVSARVLERHRAIGRVRIDIVEQPWSRLDVGSKAQGQAFAPAGVERRTATVTSNGERTAVVSGLQNLVVMRTSGFAPPRPAIDDDQGRSDGLQPLLVVTLSARWSYSTPDVAFAPYRQGARAAIIETLARDAARSLPHTLHAIGDVLLATYQEIVDVTLSAEERPYRPADLFDAGVVNPDIVFTVRDEPLATVEVTVTREA